MRTAEHHENARTVERMIEQMKRLLKQLPSTKWAALLLRTWFIAPETQQNPHFTYADVMKASIPMKLRAGVALVLALIVCARWWAVRRLLPGGGVTLAARNRWAATPGTAGH